MLTEDVDPRVARWGHSRPGVVFVYPSPVVERGARLIPGNCEQKQTKIKELRKLELTQPAYADGVMEGWEG